MRHLHSRSTGFTLLELAIVLLIVSALTMSLLGPLTNYLYQRQVNETRKNLEEIKEALLGYAAANGYLPLPDLATGTGSGDGKGDAATCATLGNGIEICSGVIPWQELGIARSDAWNNLFRYSVTKDFAHPGPIAFGVGDLSVRTRNFQGNLDSLSSEIPAIVWSIGRRSDFTDGSDEANNNKLFLLQEHRIVTRSYSDAGAAGGAFDDLVVWVSAPVLFNRMLSAGRTIAK